MKFNYLILLITISLIGCKKDNNHNGDYAFIGGEIVNTNTNFVVLSKSDHIIDTVKLDGNNRFIYKVNNLQAGLYSFKHGGEFQVVLLEPNDSVMLRLNTLEFDESLVYTGEGAKKNNYLINEYLKNEVEEKKIFKYCQLSPEAYQKQIDSLKNSKLKKLKKFKKKCDTSDLFDKIAQVNIEYNYYFNKEIYPFVHYGSHKNKILESLPKDFYNYRKKVSYNDPFLKDYFMYNAFLRSNIDNIALKEHYKHSKDKRHRGSNMCYNMDKLILVDSLITDPDIKEKLLYNYTTSYLVKSKSEQNNNTILAFYKNKSLNTEKKENVTNYVNALNKLKVGATIPDVKLIDASNSETNINTIINSPTVICFWSQTFYKHFKESHLKINELKTKYPEVKFVMINIDDYGLNSLLKTLKRNRFSFKNEYQFKNPEVAKENLAIYPMTKTFIIDENQKIVDSKANVFARNFEQQLLGLINR